jgi:hypothetical protein
LERRNTKGKKKKMSNKTMISNLLTARTRQFALLGSAALMMLPGIVQAQSGFGGTVPTTFSITDVNNASPTAALGTFNALTIGSTSAFSLPTPLAFHLRSNAGYKLSAVTSGLTNIAEGTKTVASSTASGIQTGDIGFGITAITTTGFGASVSLAGVGGTRTDTIVPAFDYTGGSFGTILNGHSPTFSATLHSISSSTQILSGDRISSSGDNNSDDNFLTVTLGVATLPQYFTPTSFSGTITLTIAAP